MSRLRHRVRPLLRLLWLALASVLVLMALAAGITSQMLPLAERHPDRVAAWLGDRVGREVGFDRLETAWTRRGPLLRLDGLRIGGGADAVQVGAAEILVAQYAGLLPGRSLTELRLRDLALILERSDDGRWSVRGLPGQASPGGDPFAALERLGELHVIGGSLTIVAPDLDIDATIPRVDLRLRVDGRRVRAAARAWMAGDREPVHAAFDLDREGGDGRAYAALQAGRLDHWTPLVRYAGVALDDGHGRAEAWATLRGNRIAALSLRATLEEVGLRSTAGAGAAAERADFAGIRVQLHWVDSGAGWRIDVPLLRVAEGDVEQSLDGLLLAAGDRYAFSAERLDAGPALALLALSDRVPPALREWLRQARPGAVLGDVELAGVPGGAMRLHARIDELGFAGAGDRPGISGVQGLLQGNQAGLVLAFDPGAKVRVDWPSGFGEPHDITLRGELVAWREDERWQVQTPALRIDGRGYGADLRGGLGFPADGGRPHIDLAARLDDAHVSVAKRFWIRHEMSEATIEWLDAALVGGMVRNGRAVVSGDLDHWPFRGTAAAPALGLFHAEAELDGVELKFQPDWPAAEALAGTVRFIADGFDVKGRGVLGDVRLSALEGGISEFGRALLQVRAEAAPGTDAGALLALLRQSPLEGVRDGALDQLTLAGAADARFAMQLPLDDGGDGPSIDGQVQLVGVRAQMPDWAFALEELRGEVRYDEQGFAAERLGAVQQGRAAALALRAGEGHVRDASQAFEGELRAPLDISDLLERAPQLAWLRPHAQGVSEWTVAVSVPAAPPTGPTGPPRLSLASRLVGTALELPPPLDKAADVALSTRIETPLPFGDGELVVQLGDRLALRSGAGTSITLGGAAPPPPPRAGLTIAGRTIALEALAWASLAVSASGAGGGDASASDTGLDLYSIDLQVDRLLLAGGGFADTRIVGNDADGRTTLRFDGPALAGTLVLPGASEDALVGRFERLHWRDPPRPPAAAVRSEAPEPHGPAPLEMDPARIPPIDMQVTDLRVRGVEFGETALRTVPMPGGLRVEHLRARAARQRFDLSGDWTGRGTEAMTRLTVGIGSENFGELLGGLGLAGRIRGGEGEVRLQGAWPGSPAGFRAETLRGVLALRVKDGHLIEIEPGAGRVLGLLSVAELPRRLTLDFRDFFDKGFAFNRIAGEVRFERGQARSSDLVIDGPAAEIRIDGSADLRAQTYDQTIDVLPKSGNLLTAVGAIAAGPVGAAVGAVANAVLRRPLGELGATTYRVSGPWSEPKVEVIRRESPRVAERDRAASDG